MARSKASPSSNGGFQPTELQVLIPYSQLVGLLNASGRVEALEHDLSRLKEQQEALRGELYKTMEKVLELKKLI